MVETARGHQSIIISDLSVCLPPEALTRGRQAGCWRMINYTTESGIQGTMLFAAPEDDAPPLTLPLELTGWYAIYVGINYTRSATGSILHHTMWPPDGVTWLKLTDDLGYSRFVPEQMLRHAAHLPDRTGREKEIWDSIHEVFWKSADLTRQSVHICPPAEPYNHPYLSTVANLSYLRFEPLTDEQVREWNAEQPTEETRRLIVHWCTDALTGDGAGSPAYHPTSEEWIRNELTPYPQTDVGILIMEAIRSDLCCFPSEAGRWGGSEWNPEWVNPFKTVVDIMHENNIKVFCGLRMIGATYPVTRELIQEADYYWRNQQYAIRDREGNPASSLSLAFPEVRAYWISLLRDALNFGADGIQLVFSRSGPFALYEAPVVEAFQKAFGEDPRELANDDLRWLRHRAGYVTQYLREIRQLLDEKPSRELGVTVYSNFPPLTQACDVETWLREGLIDLIVPTQARGDIPVELIKGWKQINPDVRLYADLEPRTQPGDEYVRLAKTYYVAGADGMYLWDGERRPPRASEWAVIRRLGHRDRLDNLAKKSPGYWRKYKLKTLNGLSVQYSFTDG